MLFSQAAQASDNATLICENTDGDELASTVFSQNRAAVVFKTTESTQKHTVVVTAEITSAEDSDEETVTLEVLKIDDNNGGFDRSSSQKSSYFEHTEVLKNVVCAMMG